MLLIIISSSVITILTYTYSNRSVHKLFNELVESVTNGITESISSYLQPSSDAALMTQELIQRSLVDDKYILSEESKEYALLEKKVDKMIRFMADKYYQKFNITKEELKSFLMKKMSTSYQIINMYEGMLKAYPSLDLIQFGNYDKDKVMVKEMPDGTESGKYVYTYYKDGSNEGITITCWYHATDKYYTSKKYKGFQQKMKTGGYDPTSRPWFEGAQKNYNRALKEGGEIKPHWVKAYAFTSDQIPGIACSVPAINEAGIMVGAISINMELFEITANYLAKLKIGKNGRAFILSQDDEMLAYVPETAKKQKFNNRFERRDAYQGELKKLVQTYNKKIVDKESGKTHTKKKYKLIKVNNFENPLFKKTFNEWEQIKKADEKNNDNRHNEAFVFNHDGNDYIGIITSFKEGSNQPWKVGIVVPEDDFLLEVKQNTYLIIIISIITLILSFIVALFIASRISKPLQTLVMETERIREFKLAEPALIQTPFKEMVHMGEAFHNMELGLKSFEKYVPSELVRVLVQSNKEAKLGGDKKELTVFFSDIVGFTNISESLEPEDLVIALGEYLSEMSGIIEDNFGTVDKYIGDAIMAFWGAPKDVEDHAYFACKSAIESQKKLASLRYNKWKKQDKPLFEARIGLNTGPLIVGNMGSERRMNYTVIGDTVNLASRLEGVNKFYNTSILCSERTYQMVKDRIVCRKLDLVAVKGKKEAVGIYEIVDFTGQLDSKQEKFITKYEEAFYHYLNRDFKDSQKLFAECLDIRPDVAANTFLHRSEEYIVNPPDEDWNGVYVFKTK